MYTAIPTKILLMSFFVIFVLVVVTHNLILNASIIIALFEVIGLTTTLIMVLTIPSIVGFIWKKFPCLNKLVAPNLNGKYRITITSNYEVSLNPNLEEGINPKDLIPNVFGELVITAGFFSITGYYLPDLKEPSRSQSKILFTYLKNDPSSPFFELHYTYQGSVFSPNAQTDEQSYMGSAYLEIPRDWNGKTILTGNYWTNRSWTKGLNTAGEMQWEPIPLSNGSPSK